MGEKVRIEIEDAEALVGRTIMGERVPVGTPGDYKPCVAKLPSGELLITAFFPGAFQAGSEYKVREDILLFRSGDGGRTWSGPANLTMDKGLHGREPYITVLSDGTILVTVHFLSIDVRNKSGHTMSYVHRSDDGGETWMSLLVQDRHLTPDAFVWTTRTILELSDGSLMMGAGSEGRGNNYVWRSHDGGRTWPETYRAEFRGLSDSYAEAVFNEGVWWQARSGKIHLIQRMDIQGAEQFFGEEAKKYLSKGDYCSCLIQWETTDGGHTFESPRPMGRIGEMYPSFLRVGGGMVLCTYTVRYGEGGVGVRAVLGEETEDGFRFDFKGDGIMLDTQTAAGVSSGGGFGPTVRLDDGTFVTSYSWRDAEHVTHMEVLRWRLPEG